MNTKTVVGAFTQVFLFFQRVLRRVVFNDTSPSYRDCIRALEDSDLKLFDPTPDELDQLSFPVNTAVGVSLKFTIDAGVRYIRNRKVMIAYVKSGLDSAIAAKVVGFPETRIVKLRNDSTLTLDIRGEVIHTIPMSASTERADAAVLLKSIQATIKSLDEQN